MTTTDTAPPITVVPRELTHAEWFAEGMDLFGKDMRNWGFQCPTCGSVATPADFPKGSGDLAPVECLGRHGAEGRCKRAAYGFIPGPWFVKQVDGTVVSCFPFAAPPQAPQSAPREPQATPGPENAPDAPDAAVGPGIGNEAATPGGGYWTAENGWTDGCGIGCYCHAVQPCSVCESLDVCERCETEVLVPADDMQAHLDTVHPEHVPLPSEPYLTGDDHAESES